MPKKSIVKKKQRKQALYIAARAGKINAPDGTMVPISSEINGMILGYKAGYKL